MGSGEVAGIVPVSSRELAERSRDLVQTGLRELPALLGKPVRLLIADEVLEARHAIREALQRETDIVVVGEASTGVEGLWRYKQLGPDVVCTGIDMREMGGLTMTSRICQRHPEAKVFILSVRTDPWSMESAFRAGAHEYLTKPVAADTLSATVRAVHRAPASRNVRVLGSGLDGSGTLYTMKGNGLLDAELRKVGFGDELPRDATILGITFRDGCREAGAPPEILTLGDFRRALSLPLAGLDFSLSNVGDDDLAGLGELMCLETLNLLGTRVGKGGIPFLEPQPRLRYLSLRGATLGHDALQRISRLPALEELDLSSTGVQEDALEGLAAPALRRLHLEDNQMRGEGMVALLSRMARLRELFLGGNPIEAAAIQELARFLLRQGRRDLLVRLTGGPLDEKTRSLIAKTNAPGSVGIVYQCVVPPFSGAGVVAAIAPVPGLGTRVTPRPAMRNRAIPQTAAPGSVIPQTSLSHSLRSWDLRSGPTAPQSTARGPSVPQSTASGSATSESGLGSIRVLIVDDYQEVRDSLSKILASEPDIEVVGMARDGEEALEAYDRLLPDVMTIGVNMPEMDGITATAEICRRHPDANIIVISVQSGPDYVREAILAGAKAYIVKPPSRDEVIASIRELAGRGGGATGRTPGHG